MLPTVEYHRPASLGEAVELLANLEGGVLPLAGGTDVVVDLRRGAREARHVVSLRDLPELKGVRSESGTLWIGGLTTPAQLGQSARVKASRPELLGAVSAFGNPQVRNRATIGGNLCNATSCADLPPLLIACRAEVRLVGPEGERTLPLEDLFLDARRTALGPAELLVAVSVPEKTPEDGAHYEPFGLRAAAYITVAGVAAWIRLEGGLCREARVVLGAVGPTPLLVPEAEACLVGRLPQASVLDEAAAAARDVARPVSDVRGSKAYRSDLVEILAKRALVHAIERARA